ncbi:MAG: AraC family transcriptional regulator [Treponema sp.]|nr:AraC family transcriptional regulator [Treponema sp.]
MNILVKSATILSMESSRESLHEKASHGKKIFPYIVYHSRIPEWLSGFPLHWHEEFEIILVTFGKAVFTVNGKRYVAKKNDILLIPPESIHSIERHFEDFVEYFNILFTFSLLEENSESHCTRRYFSKFLDAGNFRTIQIEENTSLHQKLFLPVQDLIQHREETFSGYELMIKSRLFEIFHNLAQENLKENASSLESSSDSSISKKNTEKIKKILSFTAEHFSEPITIQDAASICSVSESRFMGLFKQQTGMSYIQYLNNYRLEAAAEELSDSIRTKKSVTEIALQNGFENISYFIRAFRAKFDCTPKEYSRKH